MTPGKLVILLLVGCILLGGMPDSFGQNPFDLTYRKSDNKPVFDKEATKKPPVIDVTVAPPIPPPKADTNTTITPEPIGPARSDVTINPVESDSPEVVPEDTVLTETESGEENPTITKKGKKTGLMLLIMLTMALITTLVISSYRQIINKLTRAVLNANYLNLLYREHSGHFNPAYPVLYVIFFVNGGLFIYLTSTFISPNGSAFILLKCILFLLMIYGIRHLYMKYIRYVYDFDKEISQFDFSIMIFNIVVGLFLLPINAFMAFAPDVVAEVFMYTGFILFILFYIFRQLRGLLIGSKFLVTRRLYFFIYLCATEIAPLFMTIKFFFVFIV